MVLIVGHRCIGCTAWCAQEARARSVTDFLSEQRETSRAWREKQMLRTARLQILGNSSNSLAEASGGSEAAAPLEKSELRVRESGELEG